MMYMLGIWLADYHQQLAQSQTVQKLRNSIYTEAYQFQNSVREHERLVKERAELQRELELRQSRSRFSERPHASPLIDTTPSAPPPPRVEDTNLVSKIHLLGVLELELSETTSWHTLIKMVVTVLVTFFGIKLINMVFRRWEKPVAG